MKACLRSGGVAPRILDLGTRWKWVVSFTPRPLYTQGKSPCYPLDRRLGGPQNRYWTRWWREKSPVPVETRTPDHSARSPALYHWAIQAPHFTENNKNDMENVMKGFTSKTIRIVRAVIAQSVYCWATGWTIGVLGFDSRRGLGIFLLTTVSRMALGPNQPPIQGVPGALSLGVKRPVREADHSPPSSAEVKNAWSYTSTPSVRLHVVVLS
jgi:hypothetical protein